MLIMLIILNRDAFLMFFFYDYLGENADVGDLENDVVDFAAFTELLVRVDSDNTIVGDAQLCLGGQLNNIPVAVVVAIV